jgi:hypothetical protein
MEIISSLALVAASFGIVAILGTLVWCWVKLSQRYRKYYSGW